MLDKKLINCFKYLKCKDFWGKCHGSELFGGPSAVSMYR